MGTWVRLKEESNSQSQRIRWVFKSHERSREPQIGSEPGDGNLESSKVSWETWPGPLGTNCFRMKNVTSVRKSEAIAWCGYPTVASTCQTQGMSLQSAAHPPHPPATCTHCMRKCELSPPDHHRNWFWSSWPKGIIRTSRMEVCSKDVTLVPEGDPTGEGSSSLWCSILLSMGQNLSFF